MPGPVTIKPAPHGANEFSSKYRTAADNAAALLKGACSSEVKKIKNDHIIQTSFQDIKNGSNIYPRNNGFVDTAVDAYSNHQHLEIRAEDIWFSILSQLKIYINKHSEELRDMFVDHQGQKHLEILDLKDIQGDALWGIDWGKFSFKMSKMIANNIKDPSLREWILPQFTTTTKVDQAVASILMMATLQKFFTYGCGITCGLPSVTLLGQKSDWEKLATKAERLVTFGDEPKQWYELLKPILARFVLSFDAPDSEETKDFWQKIAHYSGGGSGPTYLSGWITAFCFWGGDGTSFHVPERNPGPGKEMFTMADPTPILQLDNARYHRVESDEVPPGWASVPVELNDDGLITPCTMVAGSVGMKVKSSGKELHGRAGETGLDTISIESGWWMYERKTDEELKTEKEAKAKEWEAKYGYPYYGED
ncbi:uncharacterized protein PAC_02666 [Phialocephala subalpina]|uniref:DUF4419 domain-containing protein n=1 Tax=Phialocephala subalpina TaxID=576137 RepID=A0A1L7WJ32_9HELO|nr:uncharacterized protein PAC_02666 [Phialocephala subalpina]